MRSRLQTWLLVPWARGPWHERKKAAKAGGSSGTDDTVRCDRVSITLHRPRRGRQGLLSEGQTLNRAWPGGERLGDCISDEGTSAPGPARLAPALGKPSPGKGVAKRLRQGMDAFLPTLLKNIQRTESLRCEKATSERAFRETPCDRLVPAKRPIVSLTPSDTTYGCECFAVLSSVESQSVRRGFGYWPWLRACALVAPPL